MDFEFAHKFFAWLALHPEVWPLVLALVAALFKFVEKYPRGKAFLDLLKASGLDAAGIVDAIRRFVTGKAPPQMACAKCEEAHKAHLENSK